MKENTSNIKHISYGFLPEKEKADRQVSDWIFGAESPICLSDGLILQRYLPEGEVQRGLEDMMDCATRAVVNISETKFTALVKEKMFCEENIKWLKDKGYCDEKGNVTFSDAFIAIKSGTTRYGNSLKAPADAVYRFGLIPKKMLPLEKWMRWGDFHNPQRITKEIEDLGLEFKARFPINYDIVYPDKYGEFIKKEMLDTAVYAWPEPINGVYPRVDYSYNHAIAIFPPTKWEAFDNYIDQVDGDFIKRLAPDYNLLGYSYRLIISEIRQPESTEEKKMTLFKAKNRGTNVYQKGDGDSLFHWLKDEEQVKALYGNNYSLLIKVLDNIPDSEIGFSIYSKNNILSAIIDLFSKLKGKN